MKKKSTSQSAFFNVRVLIGMFIVLAGVVLALVGFGAFSAQAQQKPAITQSINPAVLPPGFDCAQIRALGIDRQDNLRAGAIMIACGQAQGGGTASTFGAFSQLVQGLMAPTQYGGTDVNLITGNDSGSHVTQSETFSMSNPDNPNQIVVAYNDSRGVSANPINISGASVSTDGGTTFTRLTAANGQSPFQGTLGDPVMLYNSNLGTWFGIFLDTNCGGQGIGGYKSTNPSDPTSWSHFCVHNGFSDDRESAWVDQNPASPFFGRMYVSWNNFAIGGGALFVRFSDNGTTWTERQLTNNFIRDVQATGDKITGDVYVAGMDEAGGNGCNAGCGTNRSNKIYRSTDGGSTFTNTFTSANFVGPCRSSSGYFCTMYSNPAYWRHMGWGQPVAYNGVVSYVYAAKNGSDPSNVFYIRSTDKGMTFSAPLQLNTDTDQTKAQWQPNLSVSDTGALFATWYDETPRVAASCQPSSPTNLCYQMYSRKSNDNGVSWLAPGALSDVASPLPLQPDPSIVSIYVGDYDYGFGILGENLTAWADGRVPVGGQSQQNVFFDQEGGGGGGIPCGDLVSFQARCQSNGTAHRLQALLTLTTTSHSGEQVTITVDGNPNFVTINGNKAKLVINNPALGNHTVELTDPAGCFAPVITSCN